MPCILAAIAWKSAVNPILASFLACLLIAVTSKHVFYNADIPVSRKYAWCMLAGMVTGVFTFGPAVYYIVSRYGVEQLVRELSDRPFVRTTNTGFYKLWLVRRPYRLARADLRDAFLIDSYMPKADLMSAAIGGINLVNSNLEGALFSRARAENANFSSANLVGAIFIATDIRGADFYNASLSYASFRMADLSKAVFRCSILWKADFSYANLDDVDFSGASLDGAVLDTAKNLTQKQLEHACGDESTRLPLGYTIKRCGGGCL